jgi:hypothetical protein
MFSDQFDTLISKIILKKIKKNYFDAFPSKKHFKKQPQPHFLTQVLPNILYMFFATHKPQPQFLSNTYLNPTNHT